MRLICVLTSVVVRLLSQLFRLQRAIRPRPAASKAVERPTFNAPQAEPAITANHRSNINPTYQFDNFVEGKSNQLGKAAALQVSENPGGAYNPLFLYGGTGLGKTHLLHAVGNGIIKNKPDAKVVYMHSERFCTGYG